MRKSEHFEIEYQDKDNCWTQYTRSNSTHGWYMQPENR